MIFSVTIRFFRSLIFAFFWPSHHFSGPKKTIINHNIKSPLTFLETIRFKSSKSLKFLKIHFNLFFLEFSMIVNKNWICYLSTEALSFFDRRVTLPFPLSSPNYYKIAKKILWAKLERVTVRTVTMKAQKRKNLFLFLEWRNGGTVKNRTLTIRQL